MIEKLKKLDAILKDMESVAVAFSGGVDSTFLLARASLILGKNVLAVTATSSTYIEKELEFTKLFCKQNDIKHQVIVSEELDIPEFRNNPKNRCYFCKTELFKKIKQIAYANNLCAVVEGTNTDDLCDYRPGQQAIKELFIVSPLKDAGMSKNDIREASKEMGLITWDKPAMACLASRFVYGDTITKEKLSTVGIAEQFLRDRGFRNIRVRHHTDTARIEVGEEEIVKMFDKELRVEVVKKLKSLGFLYVSLDLQGYRTGSMNETILKEV